MEMNGFRNFNQLNEFLPSFIISYAFICMYGCVRACVLACVRARVCARVCCVFPVDPQYQEYLRRRQLNLQGDAVFWLFPI